MPPFAGQLVVVAGQCGKVGKTLLVTDLIAALGDLEWTAVKITPHVEADCSIQDPEHNRSPNEHTVEIREEQDRSGRTDTSRFLLAGAKKAFWLQARPGSLQEAVGPLAAHLSSAPYIVIESNAILEFWRPAIALVVLDPLNPDFKPSAEFAIPLADAFVLRSPLPVAEGRNSNFAHLPHKPRFLQNFGEPLPIGVQQLASHRLTSSGWPRGRTPCSFRG